jgi:NAD(P)-dependent dehydrogenase (short-subunit alcohol dehydrogenase family)
VACQRPAQISEWAIDPEISKKERSAKLSAAVNSRLGGLSVLLKGKNAVISGAASQRGIGRATAQLFAEHGARVAVLDLDQSACATIAAGLTGEGHIGIRCDVTDQASCAAAAAATLERFDRVDILINNAGITQPLKTLEVTPENWERVINVNLTGVLLLSQAFIPNMKANGGGSIACMSSVSAQRGGGVFGGPHYSAAKAGVLGLAKAMAREFGPDGIRVNAVTPGLIQTDITGGKLTDEMRANTLKSIPLNRLGDAVDVARIYLFLASDLSAYVTGATIDVNGGMLIH